MRTFLLPATVALGLGLVSCETPPPGVPAASAETSVPTSEPYPLKTCLVSDEDLESMGGSITNVHKGQEVKFCCKSCLKEFEAEPARFLAKLK